MKLSRRDTLRASGALGLVHLVPGCSRSRETHEARETKGAPSTAATADGRGVPPAWPRRVEHEGVEIIELFPDGADESSPLIVAIHGRGDRPESWVEAWRTFPARVRIALPRAFEPFLGGFSWFPLTATMGDEELGAAVGAAEERLSRGLARLAGGRRMLVTGFSQGGILSYVMASRRADMVAKAFPVAGLCPKPLWPGMSRRAAPIVAFHGTDDHVIPFEGGRAAVEAFKAHGTEAELRPYEGVGHAMPQALRADLWSEIRKALPRA